MPLKSPEPLPNIPSVAILGLGSFGKNHLRIYRELAAQGKIHLSAIVEPRSEQLQAFSAESQPPAFTPAFTPPAFTSVAFTSIDQMLAARSRGEITVSAASVCVPTIHHAAVADGLLREDIDVLVEKPFATSVAEADSLIDLAAQHQCILQIGHLERFNPAFMAASSRVNRPMFFECHRLSPFTPRSLDVDVVLDLMIHDLDLVLQLSPSPVVEIRAVGLPILSSSVDIANVRIEFTSGCIANFTASRVSTERIRKLRLFQPHQYLSLDFSRQDLLIVNVDPERKSISREDAGPALSFEKPQITQAEPLRLEIESFLESVRTRAQPAVSGKQAREALALALDINQTIAEHRQRSGLL